MNAIALLLLLTAAGVPQQAGTVQLRSEVRPTGPVWVGQRTTIYVTVVLPERPDRSPRFSLPLVPGALFRQAPGSPLLGSERSGPQEFITQRFEFLLFPQRAGQLTVPPIPVDVSLGGQLFALETTQFEIESRLPPGVDPGTALITTPSLTILQTWEPVATAASTGREPPVLRLEVGAALRRTLAISASDLLAVAIPPLSLPSTDGLASYPAQPVLSDRMQRGALTCTRTDSTTYICTAPGFFELPALLYRWWNPERAVLEELELPGLSVHVLPAKTAAASLLPGVPAAPGRSSSGWLIGLVGAGFVLLMALVLRKSLVPRWALMRHRAETSERARFHRLTRACRGGQARPTWAALVPWLRHPSLGPAGRSLNAAALALGGPQLAMAIEDLQRALLSDETAWSGAALLTALRRARRAGVRSTRAVSALPPLNPTAT